MTNFLSSLYILEINPVWCEVGEDLFPFCLLTVLLYRSFSVLGGQIVWVKLDSHKTQFQALSLISTAEKFEWKWLNIDSMLGALCYSSNYPKINKLERPTRARLVLLAADVECGFASVFSCGKWVFLGLQILLEHGGQLPTSQLLAPC